MYTPLPRFRLPSSLFQNRYLPKSGARITFNFLGCPLCRTDISIPAVPSLHAIVEEIVALRDSVAAKARMRAVYEGLDQSPEVINKGGRFYQDLSGFAMDKFAYYQCFTCKQPYYGGEHACAAAGNIGDVKMDEFICGGCKPHSAEQDCPKHGQDYLEFKCRFCCR